MPEALAATATDVAHPLDSVTDAPLSPALHRFLKRASDIAVCITAAPAVIVCLCVAAAMIALTMGRPIFFVQDRIGLSGRKFKMFKLRTMTSQQNTADRLTATAVGDPRITPLGSLLRRSHIDELPQLWNILRGDMTLIGPRPEQPRLVQRYSAMLPDYDKRHLVKPGLSGWAQVQYGYAADLHETSIKLRYDLFYVKNYSIWLDMKIVALTLLIFMNKRYVR